MDEHPEVRLPTSSAQPRKWSTALSWLCLSAASVYFLANLHFTATQSDAQALASLASHTQFMPLLYVAAFITLPRGAAALSWLHYASVLALYGLHFARPAWNGLLPPEGNALAHTWFIVLLTQPCYILALQYITRLKRRLLESEHKAHADKRHFLARLSHEMRSPLQAMLGSIDLLAMKVQQGPEKRAVDRLRHATGQLEAYLRDELARSDAMSLPHAVTMVACCHAPSTAGFAMTAPAPTSLPLGTPLSPSAVRVMLLGAGELGKEVLIALQRLGVETIAVDRYEHAPGQQVAHHSRTITMSDPAQLRALIEAERPHLVVPEIEAIATSVLQEMEAQGLVRVIPTARAARLTMDREGIRRLAAETLALPTSPYRFCDSLAELQATIDEGIGYPCIVKPVMSSSGKGQSKIDGPADVQKAWDHAMAGGRVSHGRIIVEGFINFDYEITLLTVRAAGHGLDAGHITTHFCEPIGHLQVSGDYVESWQPHPMHPEALRKAREIAKAVTDNLGGQGLFGVELFVKGDMVWFSEVSPRPHDTGLVTLSTQVQSEFELHARAILGLPVDTTLRSPGASAVIYGGVDAQDVVFDGVAEALAVPGTDVRLFGKPESFVNRRMGVALAFDQDVEAARAKARNAAAKVKPRLRRAD